MAARLPGGGDEGAMIVDINVTPLVDVTLVLLIVFLVTASLLPASSLRVDLPEARPDEGAPAAALTLTVTKDGALHVDGAPAREADVPAVVREALRRRPALQAVIAADRGVSHGRVVEVIDLVKRAGVHRFALHVAGAGVP